MLELALRYARDHHLLVVPADPATKGALSLNWTNDPSRLFTQHHHDRRQIPAGMKIGDPVPFGSSKDEAQIREWWQRWPKAIVAIRTGEVNGVVVADVDRHGAVGWLQDAEDNSRHQADRDRLRADAGQRLAHLLQISGRAEVRDARRRHRLPRRRAEW